EDASFAVLHGLYWLTANLAEEQPLLLCIDDLHWCDRPSLRFVAYLARRLEGLDALLAVSLRTVDAAADPVILGELADARDAVHLRLRPLSEPAVSELVRVRLDATPDGVFTVACAAATGGNPLLLGQLLSSLEADGVTPEARHAPIVREVGPRAVSRSVLLRLQRLPDDATGVAQAVAVLGDGAELPLVAAVSGLDERAVVDATAALARADILRADPPLAFVHPLVAHAVYHSLPTGERQLRHASAAERLMQVAAAPEEVATHLLACPRRNEVWVVDVLTEAAASARARGAADSAVAYLQRALEERPPTQRRRRVLLELGLAETLTSAPAAADHLRQAWEELEDAHERAEVAITLARTLIYTAPAQQAVAFVRHALAQVPFDLVDERQALRAIELMAVPLGASRESAAALRATLRIEGDGPGAKMLAAAAAEVGALTGETTDRCVRLATRALADGVLIDAEPGFLRNAAPWVLVMADRDDALEVWEQMRAHAHRRGSLFGFLGTNLWSGASLLWRGELPEAESRLLSALENARDWGLLESGAAYGPALAFTAAVRILRGDLEGARRLVDPAGGDRRRVDSSRLTLSSRAELLLAEPGREEEALAAADELAGRFGEIVNPGWARWRSQKARALAGLGRSDEALAVAREELTHARNFGSPSVVGRSLRVLGALEGEEGILHLRQAVTLLERSTAKLELAFALFALGAVLRRERKPTEAREPLRRALDLAERCGAEPLAAQARGELYAAGARPRRTALSGIEALTTSERRVADLAAAGRSNKEIAQTLYVTLKTVEVHLSNAYRKLDIRSRRELGRALAT
ncbi:MAG TPA: LuxR C-terminal-related transcriptional regulator, partial [Solirubrobacteraceae bacterium]|nr:LuxR C-terminal-related transcriptional regulator [Solirubrobacteraceae bacterium]